MSLKNEETMEFLATMVTAWLVVIWATHVFLPAFANRVNFMTLLDNGTLRIISVIVLIIGIPAAIVRTSKFIKRIKTEKIDEPKRFVKILLFNFFINIVVCSLIFGLAGLIPYMSNAFTGIVSVLVASIAIGFINSFAAPMVTSGTNYTAIRRFVYFAVNFATIWIVSRFMWGSFFGLIVTIDVNIFPTALIIAIVMAIICRKGIYSSKLYDWIFDKAKYRRDRAESAKIYAQVAAYKRDRDFNRTVNHLYRNTEAGEKARDLAKKINE